MPPIVNSNAHITCLHGGKVQVIPKQASLLVGGAPALLEGDLNGSPIIGCPVVPNPSGTTKPCLMVVATIPALSSSKTTMSQGRPVMVSTLNGATDGLPPNPMNLLVAFPGQTAVQA